MDKQVKKNLEREIRIGYRLNHDNIMREFETIDTIGNVYMVNEYVKGINMNDYVKNNIKLPE